MTSQNTDETRETDMANTDNHNRSSDDNNSASDENVGEE